MIIYTGLISSLPDQLLQRIRLKLGSYHADLARDIGLALGSGAHLTALRRTRIGDVRVEDCMNMEAFPEWLEQQEIERLKE